MFKTIVSVITTLSLLASANAQCNGTQYLEVTLWDSFGDGWDEAYWMMHDPAGLLSKDQSTCDEIEKKFIVDPCDHDPRSGFYYMIVNTMDEQLPEGWWEAYWKVEVFWPNGTTTGEYYEGVYNTTMVWEYDEVTDRWTLTHYDGIPDFECDGCSGGPCKPKPKPKSKAKGDKKDKRRAGKGPIKGKGGKGKDDTESNSTASSISEDSSSEMKYGPRAVNLTVKMFDVADENGNCNGWNDINRIGAHWYIADYSKTKLFDDGSLCDGCAGSCKICLGDGSYVFRVTGPTFNETQEDIWWDLVGIEESSTKDHSVLDQYRAPYTAWEFCHAKGFFNDQLNFHVKKGKCIPDDLRWADEICDSQENSTVILNGVIALAGITSEMLQTSDMSALSSVIASTVDGWEAHKVDIISTSLDVRSLSTGERALSVFTHDVVFTVTFKAEDFGIDGASYDSVNNLVSDMAATIEASLSSGAFTASLSNTAKLSNAVLLGEVVGGELLHLDIDSIAFTHNHLVYVYDDETASVSTGSSLISSFSSTVVVVGGVIGVVAFVALVGVATHNFNGYKKVSSDSDSEVRPTDADMYVNREVELEEVLHPFANTDGGAKKMVFPTRRV